MSQSRTFDFVAPRKTELLNRQQFKVAHSGLYSGYNVVIDTGNLGAAADAIEIVNAPDLTSVSVSREGVRIEETGTIVKLDVDAGDGQDRIDLVVIQHTFSSSNNPATYAVIKGTPGSPPSPPAVPIDAVVLAEVHVPTSAGSIAIQNIIRRPKEQASLDDEDTSRLTNVENATHAPVADITALKAIPPEERSDNQILLVKDDGTTVSIFYRFDSSSTDTADGFRIVIPNTFSLGTAGRWFRLSSEEGIFVAKIGGISPDYAGSAIRDAFSDFENSKQKAALFIVREDMTFSGGNLTVTKPFKMIGQHATQYSLNFSGSDILTFDQEAASFRSFREAEFFHIRLQRLSTGTGGIRFPKPASLIVKSGFITDQATGPTTDFIIFSDTGVVELEDTRLASQPNQNLITESGGVFLKVICRSCQISEINGTLFNATELDLHLLESTTFVAQVFTDVTNLRVFLDGTSILFGSTQVPAPSGTLEVAGNDFWTNRFALLTGLGVDKAMNFNISGTLDLGSGIAFPVPVNTAITREGLHVRGLHDPSGPNATVLTTTMGATTDNVFDLSVGGTIWENLVFEVTGIVSHIGTIFSQTVGSPQFGHKWLNCIFYAEGASGDLNQVILVTGPVELFSKHLIRDCVFMESQIGTPSTFAKVIRIDRADIERCTLANFGIVGVSGDGDRTRVFHCVFDMSDVSGVQGRAIQGAIAVKNRIAAPTGNFNGTGTVGIDDTPYADGNEINCSNNALTFRPINVGIEMSVSPSRVVNNRILRANDKGINVGSATSIIAKNLIQLCNDDGIHLLAASNRNTIEGNVCLSNTGFGIGAIAAGTDFNMILGNITRLNTAGGLESANFGAASKPTPFASFNQDNT